MREGQSLLSPSPPGPLKGVRLALFALLLLWNVLLFILVVVSLTKKSTVVQNSYSTYKSSIVIQFAGPHGTQAGKVVSTDVNGNLVVGAGLSIYLNSSILDAQEPLKHLVVTSLSSTMVVVAFETGNVAKISVGFVNGIQISWNTPTTLALHNVDSIISLSPSLVVITGTPSVLPLSISSDGTITQGQAYIFAHGSSIDPQTAPLSSSSFAISFYQLAGNEYSLLTSVCTVDSSLQLTFSGSLIYAGDQVSHGILPLTSTSYLLIYPDLLSSSPSPLTPSGAPLVAQLVFILPNASLSLPPLSAALNGSFANYFFATARLSDTHGAVLFVDTSRNNALVAVTLALDFQNGTGSLAFGSALVVNGGDASGVTTFGLWNFIDLVALDSRRFVAAYSDLANSGSVVATLCELSPNQEIVLVSATFVVSTPDPDMDYYWVASTALSSSQFLVMDSLSGPTGVTGGKVAFAEMKANPIGITGELDSATSQWSVVVSGVANVSSALTKGKYYFATSQGGLVSGDSTSDFVLFPRPGQYITSGNVLVSVESLVGVAVSEDSILLQ